MLGVALFVVAATASATDAPGTESPDAGDRPSQGQPAVERPHLLSARLQLGLGPFAFHASAGGEGWLGEAVGLGAHVAAFTSGESLWEYQAAWGGGPSVGLRTSAIDSYGLLTIAFGVARTETGETTIMGGGAPTRRSWALLLASGAGWIYHLGGFEIGPMLRLDAAGPAAAFTVNLAVGFATAGGANGR